MHVFFKTLITTMFSEPTTPSLKLPIPLTLSLGLEDGQVVGVNFAGGIFNAGGAGPLHPPAPAPANGGDADMEDQDDWEKLDDSPE